MKALAPEHLRLLQAAADAREVIRGALVGRSDARDALGKAAAILTAGIKARMRRGAVKAALMHPKGAGMSDAAIAKHVGVDEATVRNWRERLSSEVPQPTVSAWRQKMDATYKIYKSTSRTGSDGRTINTSRIGKRPEPEASAPDPEPPPLRGFAIPNLATETASPANAKFTVPGAYHQ